MFTVIDIATIDRAITSEVARFYTYWQIYPNAILLSPSYFYSLSRSPLFDRASNAMLYTYRGYLVIRAEYGGNCQATLVTPTDTTT